MLKRAIVITIFTFAFIPQSSFAASINIPSPTDIIIGAQNFTSNIIEWFTGTTEAKPYAVQYFPKVAAQVAGFGGGSGSMTLYYQETTISGVSTGGMSCPAGWNQALSGYGPHYLGLLSYYPLAGNGNPMGFGPSQPPFPPPPLPPFRPPGGGPTPGNPVIVGPLTGGPDKPTNEYNGGPVLTPHGDDPLPPLPPGSNPRGVFLWPRIIPIALAQTPPAYVLDDTAIGSDSTCSVSSHAVVPFAVIYNGQISPSTFQLYSEACYTDTTTNVTTCNRCRVCYK